MRLAAAVFVLGVAFIFSVLCANVVFVSKCSSIGKLMQAFAAPLVEAPREATVETIRVTNHFARGTVAIAPLENTTSGQMQLSIYGNEVRALACACASKRALVALGRSVRRLWICTSCAHMPALVRVGRLPGRRPQSQRLLPQELR